MTAIEEKKTHAVHNYSAASTWLVCDLYYQHKRKAIDAGEVYDTSSEAADRGTKLHTICEAAFLRWINHEEGASPGNRDLLEQEADKLEGQGPDLTEDDLDAAELALGYVTGLYMDLELVNAGDPSPECITELAVPLPHEPGSFGHIDLVLYSPVDRTLWVVDYKFGAMLVGPRSPQLLGYGAAALDYVCQEFGWVVDQVVLGIVQPEDSEDPFEIAEVSLIELIEFQHHVSYVARQQREYRALRGAADPSTCQWCPFKKRCGHYQHLMIAIVEDRDWDVTLHPEKVEQVVTHRAEIEQFVTLCVEEVKEKPDQYPAWNRVRVSNGRDWNPEIDEEVVVAKLLTQDINPWQLTTPAKIVKKHPDQKDLIEGLTTEKGHHVRLRPIKKEKSK